MSQTNDVNEELERIINQYGNMILRIAYQNLKSQDDAEDIVQEVLIRLLKSNPNFDSEEHEKHWLIRVTINLCKNHFKSFWKRKVSYVDFQHPENVAIPGFVTNENVGEHSELFEAVLNLPKNYKNVIYLYYYEEYTVREIATILNKKENTVSSWLHRARALLKNREEDKYGLDESI